MLLLETGRRDTEQANTTNTTLLVNRETSLNKLSVELTGEEQDYKVESVMAPGLKSLQSSERGPQKKLYHLPERQRNVMGGGQLLG